VSLLPTSSAGARHRESIAVQLRTFFATRDEDIAAVYLFGSVARGEARPSSDVDVGVLYRTAPPRTLEAVPAKMETDLTRALGRPVEVVVLDWAPVDLVHRVLRDGVLVLDRDRSRRIAFEVRARNVYWDIQPILREYRRPRGRR
jgi:predicted nucleotidyltransferase